MANILKFYGTNLKISGHLHTIPLEWFNPAKQTYSYKLIRPFQTTESKRAINIKWFFAVASYILILFQAVQIFLCNNVGIEISLLIWMLLFILTVSNYHICICRIKCPEIAAFINGLIQFDKLHPKKFPKFTSMKFQEFACLVTIYGVLVSQFVFPFGAVFGFHWSDPQKASLAGYWLIPNPDPLTATSLQKTIELVIKTLVMVYNYWMWNFVVTGTGFVVGMLHNLCINTILGTVDIFANVGLKSNCPKPKTTVAMYHKANIFRHIQLLMAMLNAFQKSSLVLVIIGGPVLVWVFALTNLIMSSNSDFIYVATLIMLLFDVLMADTVILGQMAMVYRKSRKVLDTLRRDYNPNLTKRDQKWQHKFYTSCAPLKIMINAVNFVDDFTPLNCLQLSINLSANMLMLD